MTTNPYLDHLDQENLGDLGMTAIATLAVARELARMNDLNEAIHAAALIVVGLEDLPADGLDAAAKRASDLVAGRGLAVPDETDGDRRIAAAARRWAERYAHRNETAYVAGYHLSCSELAEVVRQEGER